MTLITPDTIAFHAKVSEQELRDRIAREVLQSIGGLDEQGKPLPGVAVKVRRGQSRAGGYVIEVTGPMPVRLRLPRPVEGEGPA